MTDAVLFGFSQVRPLLGPFLPAQPPHGRLALLERSHPGQARGDLPLARLRLLHHQPPHLHRLQPDVQAGLREALTVPVPQVPRAPLRLLRVRGDRPPLQPVRLRLRGPEHEPVRIRGSHRPGLIPIPMIRLHHSFFLFCYLMMQQKTFGIV